MESMELTDATESTEFTDAALSTDVADATDAIDTTENADISVAIVINDKNDKIVIQDILLHKTNLRIGLPRVVGSGSTKTGSVPVGRTSILRSSAECEVTPRLFDFGILLLKVFLKKNMDGENVT